MPNSVLLPLSFILWERLKEREMKRKTLFSLSVTSFKLESSNILLKIGAFVNGWKPPDSHVLYSVVPLSCFVTFDSYFKLPFFICMPVKWENHHLVSPEVQLLTSGSQ